MKVLGDSIEYTDYWLTVDSTDHFVLTNNLGGVWSENVQLLPLNFISHIGFQQVYTWVSSYNQASLLAWPVL
jgi:hypothetical protein